MPAPGEMSCREVLRKVTAYLEGALAPSERAHFEAHCGACPQCGLRLAEMQALVGAIGRLADKKESGGAEKQRLVALFRKHGLHNPGRPRPRLPLGLDEAVAAPGDHLAYFWESEQDFAATAGFVAAGASQGESCILFGHEEANERIQAAIRRSGIDTTALKRRGRLSTVSGMRSAEAALEDIAEHVKFSVDRGTPLVRILGNLGWGRSGWPRDREILRLEALVTGAVRKLPVVLICAYDVRGVPGRTLLLGGLECHPLTYRRNALRTNELYVPAERFLPTLPVELNVRRVRGRAGR